MANLKGVVTSKGKLGSNQNLAADSQSALVITAIATSEFPLNEVKEIYQLSDVENLGITPGYDQEHKINVYRHIREFYRMAGDGVKLFIKLVALETSLVDTIKNHSKDVLIKAKGGVKQIGFAKNHSSETEVSSITILNGIPKDVFDAIAEAQGLYNWAYDNNMPLQIFNEGYCFTGPAAATQNLRAIENLNADKVTVFIGQDYKHAKSKEGLAQKYADIGTCLGVCAAAKVNQNIGNHELFNLTDSILKSWEEPGISSHQSNAEVYDYFQSLEDKGYVFGFEYPPLAGVRINGDHVCAPVIIDTDNSINEHSVSLGRVNDKAIRQLRAVYLPKVKTDWLVESKTGKLPAGVIVALEDIGDNMFGKMIQRGEISFGKTYVDPNSDLIVAKTLIIKYKIVPKGMIGEIKGTINLKTQV